MYALAFARTFHVIVKSFLRSFNCHRYLLSSVSFFFFSCLKDIWWFLHLVLNSVAVRPTYVSVLSSVATSAWYTISFAKAFTSQWTISFVSAVAHFCGLDLTWLYGFLFRSISRGSRYGRARRSGLRPD